MDLLNLPENFILDRGAPTELYRVFEKDIGGLNECFIDIRRNLCCHFWNYNPAFEIGFEN
jgi:hypothetical protein